MTKAASFDASVMNHAPRREASSCVRFGVAGFALALALVVGLPALTAWVSTGVVARAVSFAVSAFVLVAIGARAGRGFDVLRRRSLEDPVTRVGNRRHWDDCLEVEVSRAVRARMPLSVLIVDVDHLKELNDAHGHGCGDRALALVGEVLRETCRSRDVVARFGGDEFAILLPRTRVMEAAIVAERIREELARRRELPGAPVDARVTVSIGAADLDGVSERRPDLLFESADRALYLAKSAGRDRIEVSVTRCESGVICLDERRAARNGRFSA